MSALFSNPEFASNLLDVIQVLGLALIAAWFKYRSDHWERMTERTQKVVQESKDILQQNTDLTEQLASQTNGITDKLLSVAKTTGYAVAKMRAAADLDDPEARDALEALEIEFRKDKKDFEK